MASNTSKKELIVNYNLSFSQKKKIFFESNISLSTNFSLLNVVGEVGSGKSCFLKIIAGIIQPSSCYIAFDGLELTNTQKKIFIPLQKRKIVYLWQETTLFPAPEYPENLLIAPNAKNFPCKNKLIDSFQVQKLLNKIPAELSGGEKQKIALLQAMFSKPKLLLLDESFSCLNVSLKKHLIKELSIFQNKYKVSIIYVSHSNEELSHLKHQKIILKKGKLQSIT